MDIPTIPVFKPQLFDAPEHLLGTLASSWWGTGPMVAQFEQAFGRYVGAEAERCLMVNSCTAALHLAAKIYPDARRFFVPALTFISTGLAPVYEGKRIVFVEVGDDLCLDPKDTLNKLVSEKDVVIAVHMGGHPANLMPLRGRCRIIEDCAHALGSFEGTRHVGTRSPGCFSFQATKVLPIGDGGMLVLPEDSDRERIEALSWCGIQSTTWNRMTGTYSWQYSVGEEGYKYRANDLMASLALDQWSALGHILLEKIKIATRYNSELYGLPWLRLPVTRSMTQPNWQEYIVRTQLRDRLHDHLESLAISTTVHYVPIHRYKPFLTVDSGMVVHDALPKTEQIASEVLTIPCYAGMTEEEQERVIDGIRTFKP